MLPLISNFTCDGLSVHYKVPKGSRELASNDGSVLYVAYNTLIVSIGLLDANKSLFQKLPSNFLVYMVTANNTLDGVLSEILCHHHRCT